MGVYCFHVVGPSLRLRDFVIRKTSSFLSPRSLNLGGRRSTTDDVAKIPFQPVGLKTLLHQGLSEPEFYGDLVYKFKQIVGRADFSDQLKKLSFVTNVSDIT